MCYHYSIARTAEEIALRYNTDIKPQKVNPDPFHYYVNGFSFDRLPVVYQDDTSGKLKLELMQWGMVPGWVKGEEQALKIRSATLNARSETVQDKPSFKGAFRYRPCLVPATGYFEWMHFKGKKYPFYIYVPELPVYSYAGIWDEWVNKNSGEILRSFSILTCEANSLTSRIHNTKKRMPLILEQPSENKWFDFAVRRNNLGNIMKPYDAEKMDAFTISRLITSRDKDPDVPEVISPFKYPELSYS